MPEGAALAGVQSTNEMMNACRRDDVPGCVVEFGEYYNRVLIQGKMVEKARVTGGKLRKALRGIESQIAERMAVRERR